MLQFLSWGFLLGRGVWELKGETAVRGILWVEVNDSDWSQMSISEEKPHISSVNAVAST